MAGLVPFNRRNALSTGMTDLYDVVDELFNLGWPTRRSGAISAFKLDVEETEDAYIITAELPGVKKEEVELDINEGRLTISVRHEEEVSDEKRNYIHKERRLNAMSRSVYLSDAEREGVKARLTDGVLYITAPKMEKARRSGKIDIE